MGKQLTCTLGRCVGQLVISVCFSNGSSGVREHEGI